MPLIPFLTYPTLLTSSLGNVPSCCGHCWHFLPGDVSLSSSEVFLGRTQLPEAPGPSRRRMRHIRPPASPQQAPWELWGLQEEGGKQVGLWGAAVEQLPFPLPWLTGPLPFPSLELRCWEQSQNPWKPQRKLEIQREEEAERLLTNSGEGKGIFSSLMSKSLKHHFPLPSSLSTKGFASVSLQGCRNEGGWFSLGGTGRPWSPGQGSG